MKNALQLTVSKLEDHQYSLCCLLLGVEAQLVKGKPGVPDGFEQQAEKAKMSNVFAYFLCYLCAKNKGAMRNIKPPGLSDNSVLLSTFYALLRMLHPHLAASPLTESGLSTFPAMEIFLRGSTEGDSSMYAGLPRVGGNLSFLLKVSRPPSAPIAFAPGAVTRFRS